MFNNFPKLSYDDICLNLTEKYPNICIKYTSNNFKYYKSSEEKLEKLRSDDNILITNIKFRNEYLQKDYYKYINSDDKPIEIRIYSTKNNLLNLSDEKIKQFYIDGTYKIVPDTDLFKAVILLLGFNYTENLYK